MFQGSIVFSVPSPVPELIYSSVVPIPANPLNTRPWNSTFHEEPDQRKADHNFRLISWSGTQVIVSEERDVMQELLVLLH